MKKIASLLSLVLVFSLLACAFTSCGQKSNMRDMAEALQAGKVDKNLVDIEKIDGEKLPDGEYDNTGSSDYTLYSYKMEGASGGMSAGEKRSASLRQTTKNVVIKAGNEAQNYSDYTMQEEYCHLTWYFDPSAQTGDYIRVNASCKSAGLVDKIPYFTISFNLYEIEPFTDNVNSTEPFFEVSDLKNIEISEYDSGFGMVEDAKWETVNAEHLVAVVDLLNRDLAKMVKTCAEAGYPVVIPEQ